MIKKVSFILISLAVFFSMFQVPIAAEKTLGDIKQELEQYKEDYANNQLQIELSEQEKREAQARIDEIGIRVNEINKEVISLNLEIDTLNLEIEKLNEEIYLLDIEIQKNEEEIKDILTFFQIENGEEAYLEYAFGAEDFTDFIYRVAVSEQVTTYNDELIKQHEENIKQHENSILLNQQKKEELNTKKADLATQEANLIIEQENLDIEVKKIEAALTLLDERMMSIEELISAKEQEIKVFTDNGCTDDQTLNDCQISILPEDTSFWRPMEVGMISGSLGLFGPRYPCGGAVSCNHKGMDYTVYGGSSGTVPIYSAASGIVVYVMNYNTTMCSPKRVYVQHNVNGEIYTTGYLHLNSIKVSVGDYVSKDTIVGYMGGHESIDTCSTGAHLHFEVSTGTFSGSSVTYYSRLFDPSDVVNLPASVNTYWYDRTKKY